MSKPDNAYDQCHSCLHYGWNGPLDDDSEDETCSEGHELYTSHCIDWKDWNNEQP